MLVSGPMGVCFLHRPLGTSGWFHSAPGEHLGYSLLLRSRPSSHFSRILHGGLRLPEGSPYLLPGIPHFLNVDVGHLSTFLHVSGFLMFGDSAAYHSLR